MYRNYMPCFLERNQMMRRSFHLHQTEPQRIEKTTSFDDEFRGPYTYKMATVVQNSHGFTKMGTVLQATE